MTGFEHGSTADLPVSEQKSYRSHAEVLDMLGLPQTPQDEGLCSTPATANEDGVVGERVREARSRARLSGAALGEKVGLARDQISKIENGRRRLNGVEAPAFARALGVTLSWLLGQDETPRMALAHRLSRGANGEEATPDGLPATQTRALTVLEADRILSGIVPVPPARVSAAGRKLMDAAKTELPTNPHDRAHAQREGRELAMKVRRELELGSDEIGDLPALIEANFGVDVVLSPMGTAVDGLCAHSGDQALIIVSTDFTEEHVRFTLAHELGHHIAGDPRDLIAEDNAQMFSADSIERRVNAFAAHLLMPVAGVKQVLADSGVAPAELAAGGFRAQRVLGRLMQRFNVSLVALLVQLEEMRELTHDDVNRLRRELQVTRVEPSMTRRRLSRSIPPVGAPLTESACGVVRPPERLLNAALDAARDRRTGTRILAALLEREDEETLHHEVMAVANETGARETADPARPSRPRRRAKRG